jgi:N-terminal acetyltransferase B complex non-catalytic subunit
MSPEEHALDILLSHLQGTSDGPGQTFLVLGENPAAHASELGDLISKSLETWSSTGVVRRIVGAEHELLAEFKKMVDSKLKRLVSELASLSSVLH